MKVKALSKNSKMKRIGNLLDQEININVYKIDPLLSLAVRMKNIKSQTLAKINEIKEDGYKIAGYGASTKGNTLLQYFELDATMIDAIAERSPYKFGLRTIGTDIPIVSEDEMRAAKPDYLLVLPWHFIDEFQEREVEYLKNGGAFIVPCPDFKVIRYEDCIL